MSRCLNKATLIGYLGADPEFRTVQGGGRVANFSIATSQRWSDEHGTVREKTQWHRIVVWNSLPGTFGFVEKYLRKGSRVYVEGVIDYRSYEVEGTTRWVTEIKAEEVMPAGELARRDGKPGSTARVHTAVQTSADLQAVTL